MMVLISQINNRFLAYCFNNDLCHIVDHLVSHAGINAYPEGIVHDEISGLQTADHTVGIGAADLVKAGMLDQVAGEQQTGLHIMRLDVACNRVTVQSAFRTDRNQETKPGRTAVLSRFGQNDLISNRLQSSAQAIPIVTAALNEGGELLQLLTANGSLHICNLQVIAEVAVYILVVIAVGKLTVLAFKAVLAEVVLTGGADAVTTPVTVAEDQAVQLGVVGIDTAALP